MNGGTPKQRGSGFTIIEILIVLAVMSALFLSAVLLISGKQNVTAFNQATRNIQSKMQEIINDVGSGYYPNDGNTKCDATGPGGGPKLTAAPTEQGANSECIFLGKVLQFAIGTTDPEEYNIYTVVGVKGNSAAPSLDLGSAKARLLARGTPATDATIPDVYDVKRLLYGLSVSKMYYNNDMTKTLAAVGFTSSLGNLGDADGSQQVNVVAVPGTTLHAAKTAGVTQININLAAAVVNPPEGVQICFNSGATKQSMLLSVGGAGRQGVVNTKVFYDKDCP